MKIEIEFIVNQELENALRLHLQAIAEGESGEDRSYTESLISEIDCVRADNWSAELRNELSLFLLFRAGFQSAAGYRAEDWSTE